MMVYLVARPNAQLASTRSRDQPPAEWSRWNVSLRLAVAPAWPAEPVGVAQPATRRALSLPRSRLGGKARPAAHDLAVSAQVVEPARLQSPRRSHRPKMSSTSSSASARLGM